METTTFPKWDSAPRGKKRTLAEKRREALKGGRPLSGPRTRGLRFFRSGSKWIKQLAAAPFWLKQDQNRKEYPYLMVR